jgi:hypothetical protein
MSSLPQSSPNKWVVCGKDEGLRIAILAGLFTLHPEQGKMLWQGAFPLNPFSH